MFAILRRAPSDIASDAAYRVGLRIRERQYFRDWRRWLPIRPDDDQFPGSIAVATRVLEEIERRTGRALGDLSDAEVAPFQHHVHQIMDERRRAEFPDEEGVGRRILEELRRDYGHPDLRAVA